MLRASLTHPRWYLTGIALSAVFVTGLTFAETEHAATDGAAADSDLNTIYVTARKRTERLQDIPDSITAVSAETIQNADIQTVKDVAVRVPNVSIVEAQQPGVALINIRGVGQARNGDPPIAVVVDGVQLSNAYEITQDLFDVERIEVLKGPQGAVYGRDAIGGAINIVTKQPTNNFEGFVQVSYGTGDDRRLSAGLSGAIIDDRLLFRIAGSLRDFNGDIPSINAPRNTDANWQRDRNIRASLLAKPTDTLSIDLRYAYLQTHSGASWYAPVAPGASDDEPLPYIGDYPGNARRILNDTSAKIDLDLGGATLTSVTALSRVNSFLHEDLDYTPQSLLTAIQALRTDDLSQELRLASLGNGPLKWLGGLYYLRTQQTLRTNLYLGADYLSLLGLPVSLAPLLDSQNGARDRNGAYAAFSQVSYRFNSPLELTAALRYDLDDRHETELYAAGSPEYQKTFSSVQPKLSASWFFDPDTMAYATISKGFRSGGFNPTDIISRLYKQEEDWNYETGVKSSSLDHRVSLTSALFYTRITDRQVYILDIVDASQTLVNPIPKSEVYGAEAELNVRPTRNLDLSASIGFTGSKILSYDTSVFAGLPAAGNFTGNKLPQVAPFSYSLAAQYQYELGGDNSLTPRLEWNGSAGAYYWEIDNVDKRSAVNLVNARLIFAHGAFSVTGYVENLMKDRYVLEFVEKAWSGGSSDLSAAAPGQVWGVQVRQKF
jgi:iron complex outermembrane recepter protein